MLWEKNKFHSVMGNEDEKFRTHCNTRGGWNDLGYNLSPADFKVHFVAHFANKEKFAALLRRVIGEYGQCDIPQGKEFPPQAAPQLLNFGGHLSTLTSRDGARPYLVCGTYDGDDYVAKVKQRSDRPPWMELAADTKGVVMDKSLTPLARAVEKFKENSIEHVLQNTGSLGSLQEERESLQNFYSEYTKDVIQPFLTMLNPSLVQETMAIQPWLKDTIHTMASALFMGANARDPQIQTNFCNKFLRKPEDTLRFIDQNMGGDNQASCSHGSTRDCIHFKSVSSKNI